MEVETLVELASSGNASTVEEQWMSLIESTDVPPSEIAKYKDVLAEMCQKNRLEQAQALAWAANESLSSRLTPLEVITVAGPFLLAVGEGDELRTQVSDLYRKAYPDQEGLEELLTEAGLPSGRPVRRALRTLEVCLNIQEGNYLSSRDEDEAARVDRVEIPAWKYSITTADGHETVGAVNLADQYQPAPDDDFRVLKQFNRDQLDQKLKKDPASIVVEICQLHDNEMDSNQLQARLVPNLMSEVDWKKWWTRTRTALKNCANIKVEGRTPYSITYIDQAVGFEVRFLTEFNAQRDPVGRLDIVENYLRDCKTRSESPDTAAMKHCFDYYVTVAKKREQSKSPQAVLLWTIARLVGELAEVEEARQGIIHCLQTANKIEDSITCIEHQGILQLACESLIEAKPEDWQDRFISLMPNLPTGKCNWTTSKLLESGKTTADLEPVVQQILGQAIPHFDALLWLWDGPNENALIENITPLSILTTILRALDQCRLNEKISRDTVRTIYARVRSVIAARKYERFLQLINSIDAGMAGALRSQIIRLDAFGIAVKEDLVNHILDHHAPTDIVIDKTPIWAETGTIFATHDGFRRKKDEIDHHVNVKMRENAKAIGEAAEKGDLSENSEYKFALEERDLLQARLILMNEEMSIVQILEPEAVVTDHISIGTRVVFERESDNLKYEMIFLGPWEGDLEKGIFNYKSPLAQTLMGKEIGEMIEFDHTGAQGSYKIIEIHNEMAM